MKTKSQKPLSLQFRVPSGTKNPKPLSSLDKPLYKEMMQAIKNFRDEYGLPTENIIVGDLPKTEAGRTILRATTFGTTIRESKYIVLNSQYNTIDKVLNYEKKGKGDFIESNKPLHSSITHELAHTLWDPVWSDNAVKMKNRIGKDTFDKMYPKGSKYIKAGQEIRKVYSDWKKDKRKKGWGRYANDTVAEFWAEGINKHLTGNKDKYTRQLDKIAKTLK